MNIIRKEYNVWISSRREMENLVLAMLEKYKKRLKENCDKILWN